MALTPSFRAWESYWAAHLTPEFRASADGCGALAAVDEIRAFCHALANGTDNDAPMPDAIHQSYMNIVVHLVADYKWPTLNPSAEEYAAMEPVCDALVAFQVARIQIMFLGMQN